MQYVSICVYWNGQKLAYSSCIGRRGKMENKTQQAKDSPSQGQSLPRVLGLWDIVGIVVGGIIGSGIFIVPAAIAAEVEAPVLIFAVWIGGGILSLFGALAFAESPPLTRTPAGAIFFSGKPSESSSPSCSDGLSSW